MPKDINAAPEDENAQEFAKADAEATWNRQFTADVIQDAEDSTSEVINEQSRVGSKTLLRRELQLYKIRFQDDAEFLKLLKPLEELADMDVNATKAVWSEGDAFMQGMRNLQDYMKKLDLQQEKIRLLSQDKFKNKVTGNWYTDTELRQNGLVELNAELALESDILDDKRRACADLNYFLELQADGMLNVQPEAAAPEICRIDGRGLKIQDPLHSARDFIRSTKDRSNQPLFPHEPNPNDITQGAIGDCFLLASLSNMARLYPEKIKEAMRDNQDGTVTVRLYSKDRSGQFKPVEVTVDKVTENTPISDVGPDNCLWAACFERALIISGMYASLKAHPEHPDHWEPVPGDRREIERQYQELKDMETRGTLTGQILKVKKYEYPYLFSREGEKPHERYVVTPWPNFESVTGGDMSLAAEMLMGEEARGAQINLGDIQPGNDPKVYSEEEKRLYGMIRFGEEHHVMMGASSKSTSDVHMTSNHAYSLIGAYRDEKTGLYFVKLRNPWGRMEQKLHSIGTVAQLNAVRTTFREDGSREYEKVHTDDGYFTMELKDFIHDCSRMQFNGLDTVMPEYRAGSYGNNHYRERKMGRDTAVVRNPGTAVNHLFRMLYYTVVPEESRLNLCREDRFGQNDWALQCKTAIEHRVKTDGRRAEYNVLFGSDPVQQEENKKKEWRAFYDVIMDEVTAYCSTVPEEQRNFDGLYHRISDLLQDMQDRPEKERFRKMGMQHPGEIAGYLELFRNFLNPTEQARKENEAECKRMTDQFTALQQHLGSGGVRITADRDQADELTVHPNYSVIEKLYTDKNGIMMASVRSMSQEQPETIPFELLYMKTRVFRVEPADLIRDAGRDMRLPKEPDMRLPKEPDARLPKEPDVRLPKAPDVRKQEAEKSHLVRPQTMLLYLKAIDDISQAFAVTDSVFSHDSQEYIKLRKAVKEARRRILLCERKPFSALQKTVAALKNPLREYTDHCLLEPKKGSRRATRLRICGDLMNVIMKAEKQRKNPFEDYQKEHFRKAAEYSLTRENRHAVPTERQILERVEQLKHDKNFCAKMKSENLCRMKDPDTATLERELKGAKDPYEVTKTSILSGIIGRMGY